MQVEGDPGDDTHGADSDHTGCWAMGWSPT
jgi:hypothetical protein